MRKITYIILLFSAIFTFLIMLYAGEPSSSDWWSGMINLFGLACLPYGILVFFNLIIRGCYKKDIAIFVSTIIVSGFGLFMLIDAFFIHIDAQSGLIFLFLPISQSIVSIIGGLIGFVLHVKYPRKESGRLESTG